MAQKATVLTNPFYAALFAAIKIGDFGVLPSMGKAVGVDFDWNALHFDLLPT